jgi:BlaI family transcriptional regulator, penicillinase repressor
LAKPETDSLTQAEQRIMEALWSAGSGTVSEVQTLLDKRKPLAFNTVQTMLRILERKRFVRHREEGRAFRYFPVVDKPTASRNAVRTLVRRFFGSPGALAVNLVETEVLNDEELVRIQELIAQARRKK